MKTLFNKKQMFAWLLTLAMVLTIVPQGAYAATSDPNLTTHDGVFRQVITIDNGINSTHFEVGPANDKWIYTGYDSRRDARRTRWSRVPGSVGGVGVYTLGTAEDENGNYYSKPKVYAMAFTEPGPISLKAVNPVTNAFVNVTVVVNPKNEISSAGQVKTVIYAPGASTPSESYTDTILTDTYNSSVLYPTVFDAAHNIKNDGVLDNFTTPEYAPTYINSMTIDGQTYAEDFGTSQGWQYRIYRNGQVLPITQVIGSDDARLKNGDVVVWKYGKFNKDDLFPATHN